MPRISFLTALLPPGASPVAGFVIWAHALRAFGDGCVSLLLPFYLTLLGFSALEVGIIVTATLLGSGAMTLAAGFVAHRFRGRYLLFAASVLMAATGASFATATDFWPLLLIAFVGTFNPSSGDVSVFLPIEQALLTRTVVSRARTSLFARYSLLGALAGAVGAQAAGIPALAVEIFGTDLKTSMKAMFLFYAALGTACFMIYQRLPDELEGASETPPVPLHRSKKNRPEARCTLQFGCLRRGLCGAVAAGALAP